MLARILLPPAKNLEGAWTSIVSNWGDGRNYYHWITDDLTRLMVWEQLPEPVRVLIPAEPSKFIRESLELLGIYDRCMVLEEPCLKPERFYFSSPMAMTGAWNPLGFDWLRERFSSYFRQRGTGKPVFLTRRSKTRIPEDLSSIESAFSQAGFDILDCGTLSFRQQIEAASAAPAIAGIHGAAMTNILWAPPETPVLEIFQPAYLNGCYEQIAFQGKLDYSAVILEGRDPLTRIKEWTNKHRPLTSDL